jgi:hypothetical protein
VQSELDNLLKLATKGFITPQKYKDESTPLEARLKELQAEQGKTAKRVRNWYEVVGKTLETLTDASEKFANGQLNDKAEVLMAIGQNPVLIDGKLRITSSEWLTPVVDALPAMRAEEIRVRTMPHKIQKASEGALMSNWCTRQDSNLRPSAPQADALSS